MEAPNPGPTRPLPVTSPAYAKVDAPLKGKRFILPFVLLWLVLAAIFFASHFTFFVAGDFTELGDWGANALQIYNARHWHEIYGNYSRWGFHHPGPAFFYAYAFGELILRDVLHLVTSPYSAHAITGILLQTAFFVWALSIVRRLIPHPALLPLILLAAAIHLGAVNYNVPDSAFNSIWPPHVLAFPFFCFLTACAALASGYSRAILPAALTGALLVHGHVAQPLFVVPLFLLAIFAASLRCHHNGRSISAWARDVPGYSLAAGLAVALFLLPIALDAIKGRHSNLATIVGHFQRHPHDRKTALQSLAYFASFFCYLPNPESYCDQISSATMQMFAGRLPFIIAWFAILLVVAIGARRNAKLSPFVGWLYVYFGLGVVLTFVWGILQTGPLYNFNSHFNFGLLLVPLVLFSVTITRNSSLPSGSLWIRTCLGLALILFVGVARSWHGDPQLPAISANLAKIHGVREAARTEVEPRKFLDFDNNSWPFVVGVAVELRRLGLDYTVAERNSIMFGQEHVGDFRAAIAEKRLPVWRFGQKESSSRGFVAPGGLFVSLLPSELPASGEIRFSGGDSNAAQFAMWGWGLSTGPFSWSDGYSAMLYFRPNPSEQDIELTIDAFPFVSPRLQTQKMIVRFNGVVISEVSATEGKLTMATIPRALWNSAGGSALVSFDFPDAASPSSLALSGDTRLLGFGFKSIRLRPL